MSQVPRMPQEPHQSQESVNRPDRPTVPQSPSAAPPPRAGQPAGAEQFSEFANPPAAAPYRQDSRPQDAKEAAGQVAGDAKEQGQQVMEAAKDEMSNVGSTAKDQAKQLMDQTKSELTDQAGAQQQKLASGLRELAAELREMAQSGQRHGAASDLAQQASGHAQQIATWLDGREPGDVLQEVRRFASRRPGAFLAIAAGVGLLAGRLTRGLTADDSPSASQRSATAQPRGGQLSEPYRQVREDSVGGAQRSLPDDTYRRQGQAGHPPTADGLPRPQGSDYRDAR